MYEIDAFRYFSNKELLERVPGVFFSLSIVYFVMQCIGLIFICDPPSEVCIFRFDTLLNLINFVVGNLFVFIKNLIELYHKFYAL